MCVPNSIRSLLASAVALIVSVFPTHIGAQEPEAAQGPPAVERDTEAFFGEAPQSDGARPADPLDGDRMRPSEGVEEIIVQGQAAGAIDVEAPVSVTSFNADDLEALGVQDISDLAAYTPNTEIRTTGATTPTFFIRGVGLNDFTANGEGAIAIYQDDVVLSLPAIQLGQLFDTEDVIVSRGPQGSGPARNASGGAIKVVSKRPTGDAGGFLRGEWGRFNLVDIEGGLEVPVIGEILSSRLSFRMERRDPFVKNGCATQVPIGLERVTVPDRRAQPSLCSENSRIPIDNPDPQPGEPPAYNISDIPPGVPADVNDTNRWAARALLRFQPPATDLDWVLNVHGARVNQRFRLGQAIGVSGSFVNTEGEVVENHFGSPARGYQAAEITNLEQRIFANFGVADAPAGPERERLRNQAKRKLARRLASRLDPNPFHGDYNNPGRERMTSYGGSLTLNAQSEAVHLKNIVAVEYYNRFRNQDADYSSAAQFEAVVRDRAWQVSEDLRLSGELEDYPVQWELGGLFLMHEFDNDRQDDGGINVIDIRAIYKQRTIGGNLYASATWEFLDDYSLEGGVRYNVERKTFDQRLFRASLVPQIPGQPCKPPMSFDCDADRLEHAPTGALSLTYRAAEELTFYWKYSRGWKNSQYSAGGSTSIFQAATPESVDSFEIGSSGSWFDGRLSARVSLFHYTYTDYHVFVTRSDASEPPVREVVNADDALLYGAEADVTLAPIDGLIVDLRGGWIESEFLDFSLESFREIPLPFPAAPEATLIEQDYTGNRLPNTPRFTFTGSIQYTLELGRYGTLTPRWDFTWTEDVFFDQTEGRGNPNNDNLISLPDFAIGQEDYWLHNARLTYTTPSGGIEVAAWVRNVENQLYKALAFDATAAGFVGNILGDPRTYGITVVLSW